MSRTFAVLCGISLIATPAIGTPYFIGYEANTPGSFPEDEGWERVASGGGVNRSFDAGALVLSSADISTNDSYFWDMAGNLDPGLGELFIAEWRLRVEVNSDQTFGDPEVTIARDGTGGPFGGGFIGFEFYPDRVRESTSGAQAAFEPGMFH